VGAAAVRLPILSFNSVTTTMSSEEYLSLVSTVGKLIRTGLSEIIAVGEFRSDTDTGWLVVSTRASCRGGICPHSGSTRSSGTPTAHDGALTLVGAY
jgi:hypothetical protein